MPPTSHSFALGVVVTHIHDGHIELAKIDISVRHNNWNIGRQRDMLDLKIYLTICAMKIMIVTLWIFKR